MEESIDSQLTLKSDLESEIQKKSDSRSQLRVNLLQEGVFLIEN